MIKVILKRENIIYCRKTIKKSLIRQRLISSYNQKKKKIQDTNNEYNKDSIENILNREFNQPINEVLTSDLTYVKVNKLNYYICFIIDIYNSEIKGYSYSNQRKPEMVLKSFNTIDINLEKVRLFHTDRGCEFKNKKIDLLLSKYNITRSLSRPGKPIDNAKSESAFKTFKTAWYQDQAYTSEHELKHDIKNYVKWYNNIRPHSSLGYLSPVEYRFKMQ